MSHVCLSQKLVFNLCFINRLIPGLSINFSLIEALSPISCGNHMNNAVISVVSDLHSGHTKVIHQTLPLSSRNIC